MMEKDVKLQKKEDKHYLTGKEIRAIAKANHKQMKELEKAKKTDRLINECCFIALVVAAASAAVGLFVLLYRILKYPFIRKFAKDYDW